MRAFFDALWPAGTPGALTIFTLPSRKALHIPFSELPSFDDEDLEYLRGLEQNVYFGTNPRELGLTDSQQGKNSEILALCVLTIDLDCYDPEFPDGHKATNLPRDLDEAEPLFAHLPPPTVIVFTGGGYQLHWRLKTPIDTSTPQGRAMAKRLYKAFQARPIEEAKARGWHLDSTASLQHVYRLPGTVNQKNGKTTEVLHADADTEYEAAELVPEFFSIPSASEPSEFSESALGSADLLEAIVTALQRIDPRNRYKENIEKLLACESIAESGERDNVLQGICSTVAWHPLGREADPNVLAEIFRPTFEIWAAEPGATLTVESELQKAANKIVRSQEDYEEKQAERANELAVLARVLRIGENEKVDPAFVLQHAIINYGRQYFCFDFARGQYSHSLTQEQVINKARDAWADAPAGISLEFVNDKGKVTQKLLPQIKREYCTVAYPMVGDMSLKESYFDSNTGKFHLAQPSIRREIEPIYSEAIDAWLDVFAGTHTPEDEAKPVSEYIKDWLAVLPQLDKPNVALYLEGEKETGKTLLLLGAARLWREGGPADLDRVVGEFNEEILQNPLLGLEEGAVIKGKYMVSTKMRSLLGQSSFTINPKGLTPYSLNGYIRMVICANNSKVLDFGNESLSVADLNAICDRIYHLRVRNESSAWLAKHPEHRDWVRKDIFASHCLWLAENRIVDRFGRFWQPGNKTDLHTSMVMGNENDNLVYEWMVRFANNPIPLYTRYQASHKLPGGLVGNGSVHINSQCIIDCWDMYLKDIRKISSSATSSALSKMRDREARLGPRGSRERFHVIDPDMLIQWSVRHQIGNPEKLEKLVRMPLRFGREIDTTASLIKETEAVMREIAQSEKDEDDGDE